MYDYYHYNDPYTKGNKHIYAYGEEYESLEFCGFIYADTKSQAQKVLEANNKAWCSDCILLDYTEKEVKEELKRREEKMAYGK